MECSAAATTNWTLISGCSITEAIQVKISPTEDYTKPLLDEILVAERAILLKNINEYQPTCEFTVQILPNYKIVLLTVICSCPKVEIFSGTQCEYMETIYGETLENEDDTGEVDGYRYDVEVYKSDLSFLMLKMLTQSDEVCIFGIKLLVTPNIKEMSGLPLGINLDNVKKMLNIPSGPSETLSPTAQKCKVFLDNYAAMGANKNLIESFKKSMQLNSPQGPPTIDAAVKNYIDTKMQETETRILGKLEAVQEAQNSKLDKILSLLECRPITDTTASSSNVHLDK